LNEEIDFLDFNRTPILNSAIPIVRFFRISYDEIERDYLFSKDCYQCQYSGLKLFTLPFLILISAFTDSFPIFKNAKYPNAI